MGFEPRFPDTRCGICSTLSEKPIDQELANFFCKEPDSKYLSFANRMVSVTVI